MKHYFLYNFLPPLEIQTRPDIAFSQLLDSYNMNLNRDEKEKLKVIQLFIDLNNIYSLLTGGRWNTKGTLTQEELKERLEKREDLPSYVLEFFEKYDDLNDQKRLFSKILIDYFQNEMGKHQGFLKEFLRFERELRLMLIAYRSKRIHADIIEELQFEDLNDPLVLDIIARKDAVQYEFPFEYRDLKPAIEQAGRNPLKQHFAILKYRFNHYARFLEEAPFSLDSLLAYFVQHMILDDYYGLSKEEGKQFLDSILETS